MCITSIEVFACLELDVWDGGVGIIGLATFHGINFATNHDAVVAYSSAYYGAILGVVVDNLEVSTFDLIACAVLPWLGKGGESLEFVACLA